MIRLTGAPAWDPISLSRFYELLGENFQFTYSLRARFQYFKLVPLLSKPVGRFLIKYLSEIQCETASICYSNNMRVLNQGGDWFRNSREPHVRRTVQEHQRLSMLLYSVKTASATLAMTRMRYIIFHGNIASVNLLSLPGSECVIVRSCDTGSCYDSPPPPNRT